MQHLPSTSGGVLAGCRARDHGHDVPTSRHRLVSRPIAGYLADAPLGLQCSNCGNNCCPDLVDGDACDLCDARHRDDADHHDRHSTNRGIRTDGDYDFRNSAHHFVRTAWTTPSADASRDRSIANDDCHACRQFGLLSLFGLRSRGPLQLVCCRGPSCRTSHICNPSRSGALC